MTKALLIKEWLKNRRMFAVGMALAVFFTFYSLSGINRVKATHGVEHVWLIMLMKDQLFIDAIKYIPLLCGVLTALAQMMPEMQQNRLKLTLHLPCTARRLLAVMLGAGIAELTAIYLLMTVSIGIYYQHIIAPEMTWNVLVSSLPWFLAGYTAYLFTCAVCMEGRWKRRVTLTLTATGTVWVYFMQPVPGAYNGMLPGAVVFTLMSAALAYLSVTRFKQGMID